MNETFAHDKFVYNGLMFEVSNLSDLAGNARNNAVILLWLPDCVETPVELVGVCTPVTAAEIGWWLNYWFEQHTAEDIAQYIACQGIDLDGYPVIDSWPAE